MIYIRIVKFKLIFLFIIIFKKIVKGFRGKIASSLLAVDLSETSNKEFAIDIRDSAILWINNIENDKQYRRWPSSVMDFLRPSFPGMLRNIRKNIFNLVSSKIFTYC